MAEVRSDRDRDRTHQFAVQTNYPAGSQWRQQGDGPTTSQIIGLITMVPLGGTLLFLAGLTLVGTVIGLAITTPLFILFSPVLVPAAFLIGLAVTGFLSSGAFGVTGLSALTWVAGYLRQVGKSVNVTEDLDYAKRRVADVAAYAGHKTRDVGQTIESKARESGGTTART